MEKEKVASNIWKMYVFKAVRSFAVFFPVFVLFLQEHGLNMQEVLALEALFSVVVIGLEVPSGYFSDRFGLKKALVIGSILTALGFLILSLADDFWTFALSEIVVGVGISFLSGADTALLYDSLVQQNRVDDYQAIESTNGSIGLFSEGLGTLLGGFLALISLRVPLYVEAATVSLMIPIALSLTEPRRHTFESEENDVVKLLKLIKYSLHDHKEIKWIIIYSSVVSASTLTFVWFIQPYWKLMGLELKWFGICFAALLFSSSAFSLGANMLERLIGKKRLFLLLIGAAAAGYFLLSQVWTAWASVFMLLLYFVRGASNPVLSDFLNGYVPSDVRATILSVKNLIGRLIFAGVGPLIGWVSDVHGFQTAFAAAGGIYLVLGAISLWFMRKYKLI